MTTEIPRDDQGAPDLQMLVRLHGGYHLVPPEAWERYDHALIKWTDKLHDIFDPIAFFSFPAKQARYICESCDRPAHFGYRHEGKMFWFCAEHRIATWWADARQ